VHVAFIARGEAKYKRNFLEISKEPGYEDLNSGGLNLATVSPPHESRVIINA